MGITDSTNSILMDFLYPAITCYRPCLLYTSYGLSFFTWKIRCLGRTENVKMFLTFSDQFLDLISPVQAAPHPPLSSRTVIRSVSPSVSQSEVQTGTLLILLILSICHSPSHTQANWLAGLLKILSLFCRQ